jgi:hypothetical protein
MVEKNGPEGSENHWSEDFDNREDLYRTRRDAFRNNEIAMCELAHWKAHDDKIEYKCLYVSLSLFECLHKEERMCKLVFTTLNQINFF